MFERLCITVFLEVTGNSLAMGYASHLVVETLDASVLQSTRTNLSGALGFYYTQLGLNFLWPLFFWLHWTGIALID